MRSLWVLATALFLAGCAEPPPADLAEAAPVDPAQQAAAFNLTADLLLHRISLHRGVAFGFGLPGDANCVWLRRVPAVDELTVTATWDAVTPAWERLEMTVHHEGGQEFASGPSPLTINAKGVARDEFFDGIGTILQPEIPGPVLDQPVHLEIQAKAKVDRESELEPELELGGCTWGRLV